MVLSMCLYYNLETLFRMIIPPRRKSVAGETVLITGAGSGIGRLLALEFAKLGSRLVLWDINQDGIKETARLVMEQHKARANTYVCDCSDRAEVYRVADQVKKAALSLLFLTHSHVYQQPLAVLEAEEPTAPYGLFFSEESTAKQNTMRSAEPENNSDVHCFCEVSFA